MRKTIARALLVLTVGALFIGALAGCGGGEKPIQADLTKIINEIDAQQILAEDMEALTAATLERLYDITSAEYVQFAGRVSTVGILGDEAVIVEAVSEAAAKTIKEKMEQRYTIKLNEMDGYIPAEYEKIKGGGVVAEGNYIALLVAAEQDKLNKIFREGIYGE